MERRSFLTHLENRISTLTREKNVVFEHFVETLSDKMRLRRLIERWQTLSTQLYNHNELITSELQSARDCVRHWKALCKTNAALSDVREHHLYRMRDRLRRANLCSVCWNAPMDALLRPCRHGKFCSACVDTILGSSDPRCPLCRTTIETYEKIYI